jgi:hypothetical protein
MICTLRVSSTLLFLLFGAGLMAVADGLHDDGIPMDAMPVLPVPATPSATPADTASEPVSKRLLGVIPNYKADQYQINYQPISTMEKFSIARSDSFDWPNYFLLIGYAAQAQMASGGLSHNGGISSFGKFYTRSLGDQVIGSYLTEAILPSLLHEDPRFFRLGKGTLLFRAYYAASRIFVTKKDDGRTGFNISEVVGNTGVVALTTLYYPDSRSAPSALGRYSMALGNDMMANMLTEFWPDIRRHLPFRRHA